MKYVFNCSSVNTSSVYNIFVHQYHSVHNLLVLLFLDFCLFDPRCSLWYHDLFNFQFLHCYSSIICLFKQSYYFAYDMIYLLQRCTVFTHYVPLIVLLENLTILKTLQVWKWKFQQPNAKQLLGFYTSGLHFQSQKVFCDHYHISNFFNMVHASTVFLEYVRIWIFLFPMNQRK